jgi:hypothetical protein
MPEVDPMMMGAPPEPAGAPTGTPSGDAAPAAGEMELAKANVSIAISLLEKQIPLLGTNTEEGKALLSALSTLSKKFSGQKSEDLAPAELMQVMSAQPDGYKKSMMQEMGSGGMPPGTPPQ